jgi:hypothetical protein
VSEAQPTHAHSVAEQNVLCAAVPLHEILNAANAYRHAAATAARKPTTKPHPNENKRRRFNSTPRIRAVGLADTRVDGSVGKKSEQQELQNK